jgi:hypothetical protein
MIKKQLRWRRYTHVEKRLCPRYTNTMHSIFKLMILNKVNAITNLNYLLNSISNVNDRMKNSEFHSISLLRLEIKFLILLPNLLCVRTLNQ